MLQQHWNQDSTPVRWPRRRLYPKIFDFNFQNISSYGRKSTFLCFEVERWKNGSFLDYQKGVFQNQVAQFLEMNVNVDLSLSAARLYYENEDDQGLRDLVDAGAQVAMMAPEGESKGIWAGIWILNTAGITLCTTGESVFSTRNMCIQIIIICSRSLMKSSGTEENPWLYFWDGKMSPSSWLPELKWKSPI